MRKVIVATVSSLRSSRLMAESKCILYRTAKRKLSEEYFHSQGVLLYHLGLARP